MQQRLLGFLSLFLLAVPVRAAEPANLTERVDAIVHKHVRAGGPGVALLIVHDGKVVLQKGYGLAHIKAKEPITPRTNFELASVSKQFTALAIMILRDHGKLAFDDPIQKFLPDFPVYDKNHPIRLRDLLNHTSGLPEYLAFKSVEAKDPRWPTNADYYPLYAKHKLAFPTGARYEYCNSNYQLLADIVARVSHKSYGTFVQDEILQPLGMKETVVFENPKLHRPHPALGYQQNKNGSFHEHMDENVLVGDGSIWSNIVDLARWEDCLAEGKLAKPETWKEAYTPSKTKDGKTNGYGFGWGLTLEKGKPVGLWHAGSWTGFSTEISRYPGEKLTMVMLCNIDSFDIDKNLETPIHELFTARK